MQHRSTLLAAGLLGATGVALGAFGAHGLREALTERGMTVAWETAARYQLVHAVALIALAVWQRQASGGAARWTGWAALSWVIGIIVFSGSLYLLALGGPHWLVHVTPLGGIALLFGWVMIIPAALAKEESTGAPTR